MPSQPVTIIPMIDPAEVASEEKNDFDKVRLGQVFVGLFANILVLAILLLYRHLFREPVRFFLIVFCSIDILACLSYYLVGIGGQSVDNAFLLNSGLVSIDLEIWVLNMIRDITAWLVVFIAIEGWRNICRSSQQPSALRYVWFLVVAATLMLINTINFFVNANVSVIEHRPLSSDIAGPDLFSPVNNNRPPVISEGRQWLDKQWVAFWPYLKETKHAFIPAVIVTVLFGWNVVHYALRRGPTNETDSISGHNCKALSALILSALPVVFIATILPRSIYSIKDEFVKIEANELGSLMLRDNIVHLLADCNHTINCVIYCLALAEFRFAVVSVCRSVGESLKKCVQRKEPEPPREQRYQQLEMNSGFSVAP